MPLELQAQQLKVILREGTPLYKAKVVMVQEDQAEGFDLLYLGWYTSVKGFKAPS